MLRSRRSRTLAEEVNVDSFHHLCEIDGHSIKELSRLRVGIHLFMAESRNCRGALQKLSEKENEHDEYANADKDFSQREARCSYRKIVSARL